jgi:hypothetical protein
VGHFAKYKRYDVVVDYLNGPEVDLSSSARNAIIEHAIEDGRFDVLDLILKPREADGVCGHVGRRIVLADIEEKLATASAPGVLAYRSKRAVTTPGMTRYLWLIEINALGSYTRWNAI